MIIIGGQFFITYLKSLLSMSKGLLTKLLLFSLVGATICHLYFKNQNVKMQFCKVSEKMASNNVEPIHKFECSQHS